MPSATYGVVIMLILCWAMTIIINYQLYRRIKILRQQLNDATFRPNESARETIVLDLYGSHNGVQRFTRNLRNALPSIPGITIELTYIHPTAFYNNPQKERIEC